ncbi:hypothetical protein ABLE91_05650 [Aquabacter sp. CN5-332]|uniref:hypothetical protein n=1 Tax=Aquabacter sp. CN5-332 TaxID=3156608 RepID=UPI0032B4C4E4
MSRRALSNIPRPVPPIIGMRRIFWTLHPPRRVVVDGVRPPFTLDGPVEITMPFVRWMERRAA